MECARCGEIVAGELEVQLTVTDTERLEGMEFNGELCATCAHAVIEFVQAGGKAVDEQPINAS